MLKFKCKISKNELTLIITFWDANRDVNDDTCWVSIAKWSITCRLNFATSINARLHINRRSNLEWKATLNFFQAIFLRRFASAIFGAHLLMRRDYHVLTVSFDWGRPRFEKNAHGRRRSPSRLGIAVAMRNTFGPVPSDLWNKHLKKNFSNQ